MTNSRQQQKARAMRPLFVLSLYRSGSSLLYTLLNQHSEIALLYEADLPVLELFLRGQFRNGKWLERWEFWNQGPSRHGIPLESMPAEVSDVWQATRMVYQSVARRKQASIWGEKSPRWYNDPMRLAKKCPDASFIFLWRDMHSVLRSVTRAAATEPGFRRFARRPATLLLGNERLKRACDRLKTQGKPVHEVNYEDLTSRTAACMKEICNFLRIPFQESMTSLEGGDRSAICAGEIHELVRSSRIVRQKEREEVLTTMTRTQVSRYINYWKQQYGGSWPKYPPEMPDGALSVSRLELWCDRWADQARRWWDKAAIVLLHQLRPVVFPKKYLRDRQVLESAGSD